MKETCMKISRVENLNKNFNKISIRNVESWTNNYAKFNFILILQLLLLDRLIYRRLRVQSRHLLLIQLHQRIEKKFVLLKLLLLLLCIFNLLLNPWLILNFEILLLLLLLSKLMLLVKLIIINFVGDNNLRDILKKFVFWTLLFLLVFRITGWQRELLLLLRDTLVIRLNDW